MTSTSSWRRNGTDNEIGQPIAFIEVAWRRYTKHSRNKAQEIQGAILPLAEKYRWNNPFLGTVLAGVFTAGSLEQLKSQGFHVLYFPYETLVRALQQRGSISASMSPRQTVVFRQTADKIEQTAPAVMNQNPATPGTGESGSE